MWYDKLFTERWVSNATRFSLILYVGVILCAILQVPEQAYIDPTHTVYRRDAVSLSRKDDVKTVQQVDPAQGRSIRNTAAEFFEEFLTRPGPDVALKALAKRIGMRPYVYPLHSSLSKDLIASVKYKMKGEIEADRDSANEMATRGRDPDTYDCKSSAYSLEYSFPRILRRKKLATAPRPNAYIVPFLSWCEMLRLDIHRDRRIRKVQKYHDVVLQDIRQRNFFDMNSGTDHIFLATPEYGSLLYGSKNSELMKNAVFMVHNAERSSHWYRNHRLCVVAPDIATTGIRPLYNYTVEEQSAIQSNRTTLAYFWGDIPNDDIRDRDGLTYSKGVRQYIKASFSQHPDFKISNFTSETVSGDMLSSVFCVAPEGFHAWSAVPYYAMILGCIPVVISDELVLPYEWAVDYSKFIVRISPGKIRHIHEILKQYSTKDVQKMQHELLRNWRLFWHGVGGLGHQASLVALGVQMNLIDVKR
ncbi:hypothetical protein SARC_01819 [Sphaeroforma arctica JP610]|uniref:Exostosin GT47 domain-containing protein n=1 Tax=Sphaeroforma arctica JP610 TaxID=667725 RepID=A0A0L0GCP9_9EUKA|nr:hypothetical protein SARC_01819 [Sphaeroforma arctica JP610]KNC86018.1 hypothetical protein SARC_01819 [Sphaeroforma arctica JP610]|eukprot:XP_014159920.1 hypothetical protein SARC_01819 [Sphaeroforma arctica JP610]